LDVLTPKCLLQLREQFLTLILALSAHHHSTGQRAARGRDPELSPLSIAAHGAPCPGAGVQGALIAPLYKAAAESRGFRNQGLDLASLTICQPNLCKLFKLPAFNSPSVNWA